MVSSATINPLYNSVKCPRTGKQTSMLAKHSYFASVFIFQVPYKGRECRTDNDCEKGVWDQQSNGTVHPRKTSLYIYICQQHFEGFSSNFRKRRILCHS